MRSASAKAARSAISVSNTSSDAEFARALLQDGEQAPALDAAEAVAVRGDDVALEMDLDVVPVREAVDDALPGSASSPSRMFSSVWSENTTPQPNVSSGRLRS